MRHDASAQRRTTTATKEKDKDEQPTDAVSLPRNPESKRLIQAAQDYIKKKEWRIAAECLQSLLENPDDSFVEVRRKDKSGVEQSVRVSVRDEANRIIGELPPDGLESYQLQYGQAASDRLREATERADPVLLAEVSQRYLHTKAGLDATTLLGTFHLDRGQYFMASLCFERLLSRPDADKLSPKVLYRAALAYQRAGDVANAERWMNKVAEKVGGGDLAFNRVHLTVDQLRAEMNRDVGSEPAIGLFDWPVFRGNAGRNARGQGSTAYLEPAWKASMIKPEDPVDPHAQPAVTWIEQHLDIAYQAMKDKPILPAFFPITAGNRLLVRTYDGVSAYALAPLLFQDKPREAGNLLWRSVSAERSLFATLRDDIDGRRVAISNWYNQYYRSNNAGPLGVFFENSVIGSISHDGRRVYFIDDLGIPPHPAMLANAGNGINFGQFTNEVYHNCLCAVDLDTGKLSWLPLGGRSDDRVPTGDAPTPPARPTTGPRSAATELLDSFFLCPPLPLGGKLYLLCEKSSELRLICLDPEKLVPSPLGVKGNVPELVWIQSLGTANSKLPNDGLRRIQAAHLAYGDGILVCPTNAGAVVGIDLLTHSLAWAFSYRKSPVANYGEDVNWRFRVNGRSPSPALTERWRPSAPCVVKDKVVLTSYDATEIHCLSLRDGHRIWSNSRDDQNDLYLAGVFDGRVLIVGKNSVKAFDLETGKDIWAKSETGLPAGQGVAADGIYYLPLASSNDPKSSDKGPEICAIDIKTGNIVGHSKARRDSSGELLLPGNLLFAGNELVSQSASMVAAFPLLKIKQEEINRALAKNANDPKGLTERGELHLYNGKVPDAVADLRAALAHDPPDNVRAKARTKLFEGLTRWLQSDFNAAEQYLSEYEALCNIEPLANADAEAKLKAAAESVRRKASYLELVGKGRERQGRVLDAFNAYEQYGELAGNKELVDSIDEPSTKARPDIWSRGRIQALITNAKPEDKKLLEDEIRRRWERVRAGANLEELRRFVGMYGSMSSAGVSARIELATGLLATNDPDDLTEAERNLAMLCFTTPRPEDRPAIAHAIELMIKVCMRRGQYENAVGYYRRLGTEFGDVVLEDGRKGRDVLKDLETDKRFIPYLEAPTVPWPAPMTWKENPGLNNPRTALSLTIDPQGELLPFFDRHRLVFEAREDNALCTLRLLDRVTGEESWRVPNLPRPMNPNSYLMNPPPAYVQGHNLVLHLNNYVFAFDVMQRKELWRKNLLGADSLLNSQDNLMMMDEDRTSVMSTDSNRYRIGGVAVVESSYVCLQTRDGLVVLDSTQPGPSVMWTKKDVSANAKVFGNDRFVFVLEPEEKRQPGRYRVLRASDGSLVATADSALFATINAAFKNKIRTIRGQLLVKDDEGKAVRLLDPLTGRDIWKRDFSVKSIVAQSDDPKVVAIVEPAGLFTLLDVNTGAIEFTSHLQPGHTEKLVGATLHTDRDRYYLVLNCQPEQGMTWQSASRPGMRAVQVNGAIYALWRRSGKQDWATDVLPHQMLLVEQFADLPVLLMTAQYQKMNAANAAERQGVRVTCVDKSTGKRTLDKDFSPHALFHAMIPKPAEGKIELVRQDMKLTLQAATPSPTGKTP